MFTKTARFYDAIYGFKDYRREVDRLRELIGPDPRSLLDVACGTGKHLELLRQSYACEGLELDPAMAEIARERLPDLTVHLGDMACFDLGRTYDAVTCLFSSIGYVGSAERLNDAIEGMARHLNPNGILIVEPWFRPEQYNIGTLHSVVVDQPELKIVRMNLSRKEGRMSVMDMHCLVGTLEGVEHFVERHSLALFTDDEYRAAFTAAGLDVRFEHDGLMRDRGLYVGIMPVAASQR